MRVDVLRYRLLREFWIKFSSFHTTKERRFYIMDKIKFANLYFRGLKKEDILQEENFLKFIVTVNSEFIIKGNNDDTFKDIINDNYSTFDGQVPYFLAKNKNKNIDFEKLSGSDLIYDFCDMAKSHNKSVFLLGGYEESNQKAIIKLKERYSIEIDGYSPPYMPYPFSEEHNKIILDQINSFKPDILFVGFGAVKQEYWITEHKEKLEEIGVRWVIGSGGTFEFVAGTIARAPEWVQKIGFEGIYRMLQEPNLLRVKRLLLSFKIFRYV